MAFTLENGTGLSNSNSYAAVAFADTYHLDRGNTAWASATQTAKETALVRATDYIDGRYTFLDAKLLSTQSLLNPRTGQTALSTALVRATAQLALHALTETFAVSMTTDRVIERTEKLDGVAEVSEKFDSAAVDRFPAITAMLKDLIVTDTTGADAASLRVTR